MPVRQEEQLSVLEREGFIQRDQAEVQERLQRAEPFMDQLAADTGLRRGGQEDRQRDQQTRSVWRSLSRTGVESVTVVNLMPWPIEVTVGVHRHFVKAANWKKGERLHTRTFGLKDIRIDQCDLGDGKVSPQALTPVDIGIEFQDRYVGKEGELDFDDNGNRVNNKPGGLFVYRGTEDKPPDNFSFLVEQAESRLAEFFWIQYQAGEAAWEKHQHDPRWITERMKDGAHWCHKTAKIAVLPQWVAATKAESGVKTCPNCAEVIRAGAKQCRFCAAVLLPDGSFQRRGEAVMMPEPETETVEATPAAPTPEMRRAVAPESGNLDAPDGQSDMDVLNTPDDQLPSVKPARAAKKKGQSGDRD